LISPYSPISTHALQQTLLPKVAHFAKAHFTSLIISASQEAADLPPKESNTRLDIRCVAVGVIAASAYFRDPYYF
jgi:hypothetical protein